uniref:Uncharacterized protein n=1 Tax=Glossina pallidipes TaxID=7398 RepID=A0A1A9ZWP4_GLOPL
MKNLSFFQLYPCDQVCIYKNFVHFLCVSLELLQNDLCAMKSFQPQFLQNFKQSKTTTITTTTTTTATAATTTMAMNTRHTIFSTIFIRRRCLSQVELKPARKHIANRFILITLVEYK